ncbi:hypothetical protein [Croceivirga thetidis]|uniref:Uncharacterized protein n=1 Tax=Croceivirga thetidis TaxID=2721623 RepID=A0ABX1GSN7_9FLAO|nr:hypothetical protein [Croceivirga thetidis]NKI32953.1 hypothetical protein [Croceivirga thetidis]
MSGQLIGILGGLIGSILTVIISKILDLVQKKNEYSYDLKKQFFNKKMQAAEAAIIQYSLFSDALNQLIILFGRYKEGETAVGENLNNNLLKQINEKITQANSSSLVLSSSIGLYFDLNSNYTANEILNGFYDNLNKLAPYLENLEMTYEQYLRFIGTDQEKEAFEIYKLAEDFMAEAMKNVAEGYKLFDEELGNQMSQIRKEMKKYE